MSSVNLGEYEGYVERESKKECGGNSSEFVRRLIKQYKDKQTQLEKTDNKIFLLSQITFFSVGIAILLFALSTIFDIYSIINISAWVVCSVLVFIYVIITQNNHRKKQKVTA